MAAGKVIGKVEVTKGSIKIVDVDGGVREPKYEGFVYENEQVISNDPNALFQIKFLALPEASAYDGIFRILADGSVIHGRDAMDSIASDEDLSNILETAAGEDVGDLETAAGEEAAEGSSSFTPTNIVAESSVLGFNRGANGELGFGITDFGGESVVYDLAAQDTIPPIISSPNVVIYDENGTDPVIQVEANGESGISYSISGLDSEHFSIDPVSGVVTFNESPDFENPKDLSGDNEYNLYVTATDEAGNYTTQLLSVSINNLNDNIPVADDAANSATEDLPVDVSGQLTGSDADGNEIEFALVKGLNEGEGTLVFNSDGTYTYNIGSAFQYLDAGETKDITFTYKTVEVAGSEPSDQGPFESTEATVTIQITGTEDGPVISGTFVGAVAEDGLLSVSGTLAISDIDALDNPVSFSNVATTAGDNGYGTFELTDGTWTYNLNNTTAQVLDAGQIVNDTYTFTATDGSTQQVVVTIAGAEDASIITGTYTGSVAEDGTLIASGTLAISDIDALDNPVSFSNVATTAGDNGYGTFELTDGTWTYNLNNTTAQVLDAGQIVNDTYTFTATDGSTQQVVVTIAGAEDASIITGTYTGSVAEDGTLIASGTLAISDIDALDNPVSFSNVATTAGDNGYGTFELTDGTWTYNLNNTTAQVLDAGQIVNDTYTFTATDGSTQQVVVTIAGAEDASIITGTYTGSVAEDGTLIASGTLAISDIDALDNPVSFSNVATTAGDNGYGTFELTDGTWTYNLNNTTAQVLDAGQIVNDTYTFTATDGSTQQVVVTIAGAADGPTIIVTRTPNEIVEDSATQDTVVASFAADDVDSDNSAMIYEITSGTDPEGYYVIDGSDVKLTATGAAHVNGGGELYDISVTVSSAGLDATGSDSAPDITPAADPLVVYDGLGTIGEPLFDLADFELGDDPDFVNGVSTEYSSNGLVLSSNLPLNLNFGHGIGIDDPDLGTGDEAINIDMGEELSIELPSSVFGLNIDVKGTTADLIEIKLYEIVENAVGDEVMSEITSGITFMDSDGNLLALDSNGYIIGNDLSNTDTIVITSDVKFDTLDINNVSPSSGGQGGFTIINVYDPLSIGDGYYSYDYDMNLILQEVDEAVDSVTVSGFDDTTTKLVFTYGDSTQVEFESDGDGVITVDDADLLADVVNGDVVVTIAAQSEIPDGFQPTFDAVTIESESGIPVAHTILGGTADDILSGEDGNDYIDGRWGSDTVYGGAGNDEIEYDAFDTEIDGGVGFDTVIGASEIINLSNVSNIDVIQLNSGTSVVGSGTDLGINADDVLSATDSGTLIIQSADSDPLNQVNVDTDSLVLQSESVNIDGINYAEYIGDGGATLLIELADNITVE